MTRTSGVLKRFWDSTEYPSANRAREEAFNPHFFIAGSALLSGALALCMSMNPRYGHIMIYPSLVLFIIAVVIGYMIQRLWWKIMEHFLLGASGSAISTSIRGIWFFGMWIGAFTGIALGGIKIWLF